jgi:hypothetical protein
MRVSRIEGGVTFTYDLDLRLPEESAFATRNFAAMMQSYGDPESQIRYHYQKSEIGTICQDKVHVVKGFARFTVYQPELSETDFRHWRFDLYPAEADGKPGKRIACGIGIPQRAAIFFTDIVDSKKYRGATVLFRRPDSVGADHPLRENDELLTYLSDTTTVFDKLSEDQLVGLYDAGGPGAQKFWNLDETDRPSAWRAC